jgi:hypothetical protein
MTGRFWRPPAVITACWSAGRCARARKASLSWPFPVLLARPGDVGRTRGGSWRQVGGRGLLHTRVPSTITGQAGNAAARPTLAARITPAAPEVTCRDSLKCRFRPGAPAGLVPVFPWTWTAIAAGFFSKPAAAGEGPARPPSPAAGCDRGMFGQCSALPGGRCFQGARRNAGRDAGNRRYRW